MNRIRLLGRACLLASLVLASGEARPADLPLPRILSPSSSSSSAKSSPAVKPVNPLAKLEQSILFQPLKYPQGNWKPQGLVFEDAWFRSADGTKLHGWYVAHARPRAVVLYCHGNAGNVAFWAGVLPVLHDRVGVSVLLFDYRGYGRSEGTPDEPGVLTDARAARAWLAQRAGIAEKQIVLMGRSLGGAVAVELAARDGARGLVVESTFTSIRDVASVHYPLLPRDLVQIQLDSVGKIGRYRGPLLQSHGDADTLVPYKLGRGLFEAANEPKQFVTFRGRDHNDPPPAEYYRVLAAFLDRLP